MFPQIYTESSVWLLQAQLKAGTVDALKKAVPALTADQVSRSRACPSAQYRSTTWLILYYVWQTPLQFKGSYQSYALARNARHTLKIWPQHVVVQPYSVGIRTNSRTTPFRAAPLLG